MITRGLLTEQADGTFTCAVCIPAAMLAAVLKGEAVKIAAAAQPEIPVQWKADVAEGAPDKPPTQGVLTGGIEAPELRFGQVSEAHAALIGRIRETARDPIFQNYARKKTGADPFSGGAQCAFAFLLKSLIHSKTPEADFNELMRIFKETPQ